MLFDKNLMFSVVAGQDLAQIAGNYLFDKSLSNPAADTVPLGGTLIADDGRANEMDIGAAVTVAFISAGAATVQLQIVQADDAALTTNLEVVRETRALGYANFTKGRKINLGKIPSLSRVYWGLRAVIGTATTTAGKISAGLVRGIPSNASNLY